jgi:hypothetical protein
MFPIKSGVKQRDALSSFLFNFVLEYAIRRVDGNRKGFKLNQRHVLLVNADEVNILGGSVQGVKKYTQSLLVASREIGVEVNAETTKCMACVHTRMQDKS